MARSSISIDIDDPRTGLVAEALANKTCIKILHLLAEHDLTAGDIALRLAIPLNTTGYNLEKLIAAGLVEKSRDFFWSVKGKKTPLYRVANKRIVISPKRVVKGVLPALLLCGVIALFLGISVPPTIVTNKMQPEVASDGSQPASYVLESASRAADAVGAPNAISGSGFSPVPIGAWFALGACAALFIYVLWTFFSERREQWNTNTSYSS